MKLPELHKDRIIRIAMAAIILVLIIALIWFMPDNKNSQNESVLKFGETLTEEMAEGAEGGEEASEEKTITVPKATTSGGAQPKESTAATAVPASAGSCYPSLSGKKSQMPQGILLTWTPCSSDNFQFYKLVKSSLNSSPGYPNDPVAMSSSDKNESSFIDKTVVHPTTYYYRVCVLERLGKVTCGNIVSVTY